jgi:hypothetical protein
VSIWLLLVYAIATLTAMLAFGGHGRPMTLPVIALAITLAIFVGGLLARGIRPPVI